MKMKNKQSILATALTCALAVAATGAHAQIASTLQTSRDTRPRNGGWNLFRPSNKPVKRKTKGADA